MNRLRKKLSSADVKTPTPTTNPPSLPKPTLLPLYARFATSAAQNTSPDTGRASRDRTSKVLSVSSPMPLTKPADERRQPGRKANNGAGEERARRLQRSQPREREKEALLRGRSLDVRGDRDRQEHGKTYPTPNSSHPPSISPTRPTATPRSQSQHHHHREKEVSRKPLPSPSASPPITPRASRASLFSKPKEPDSSRRHDAPAHSSRQDAPVYSSRHDAPSSRKERAPSTSRPTNVNTGHRSRLPTPPSPTRDQHSSVQPHSHSVHRARSSQSLAPSQPAVASNPQSQYNQNQSRSRSAVRSSSRAPPRGQPIPSPQISNFSQSMYPQSPSAPAVSPHSHSHPHVLPRSPSSSQLQYPQSPTLSMYPHSPSVLPRSHFPSLQPHSQVSLQPQPLASPQLQSLASPQLQVSHPPYSRTPYNNTSLHSPGSSAPTGSLSPDAATYREKTLPRDKEKDNDRHNLRHKSRQVFHQVPDSLPSTEEKPRRQDVGDDGPRRRTLSGDTVRTQDNRLQAPEISADGSALSVTPPEKEQRASEQPEPVEVAVPLPPSVARGMEAWFPFPDGHQQLEPEPQHEQHQQQYEKERHSMDAPHGPVRGKPLIFAAMTTAADLEQMATLPPRVGHSNSYGYPSPPLEPVVVPAEEHPPAFDTPPTAEKLSAQPEPNPTPHRHSYGAEGDTSSSFLFSPQTSLRKLFKRTSREYEGRTHVGHQRSASDGETHGAGKHRPSKLQKRGTHSSKMSVTSTEMGGVAHIRPDAEMRPRTPTSGPPSPPPKSPSYGIQSAQQAQASVDRSAGVVTDPGPALTAPTDLVSGMNGTYNDPVRPEGEGGLREGGEEEGVAEQEQMPVFTPPRGAKPPTPPISPDEYARSRSRRRGQRLEAITAVVKDIKGKARAVPINPGLPYPLVKHLSNPEILPALLEQLSFWDWCSLSAVSKAIGKMFVKSRDLRECALERYLGSVGYSRWTWDEEEPLVLSIKDMHAYMQGVSMPTHQYHLMAQTYLASPKTNTDIIRNLAFCTRSYNRVVLRLRAQAEIMERYSHRRRLSDPPRDSNGYNSRAPTVGRSQSRLPSRAPSPNSFHGRNSNHQVGSGTYSRAASQTRSPSRLSPTVIQTSTSGSTLNSGQSVTFRSPLYRVRRAPLLYVFVPSPEGEWLSDTSVLECEAELKRAGVAHLLRPGDVVWDTAVGDEGNVGRMVWDGGYLLDLDYTFSMTGELPQYLHSLAFPPSYFHRVIRSVNNPICYVDISPWSEEIADNLQLLQDRVKTETPQGTYHTVVRWVHRSSFVVKPPSIKMRIPNTDLFIDPGWFGTVVVEAEGTNEGLADLQDRCRDAFPPRAGSENKPPSRVFRILRERSRPGEIWIRTIREKERLM